jgi:hypothetical protein
MTCRASGDTADADPGHQGGPLVMLCLAFGGLAHAAVHVNSSTDQGDFLMSAVVILNAVFALFVTVGVLSVVGWGVASDRRWHQRGRVAHSI